MIQAYVIYNMLCLVKKFILKINKIKNRKLEKKTGKFITKKKTG